MFNNFFFQNFLLVFFRENYQELIQKGVTRSCADDQSLKCNCDKNDNKWREDSGFLTIKSHLPVKQLRFGDTGGAHLGEEGYHTLGKLECYGMI